MRSGGWVRSALRRGSSSGRPRSSAKSSQLDRVLISEVGEGCSSRGRSSRPTMQAGALAALDQLRQSSIRLEYPLVEDEVVARQRAALVDVGASRSRAAARLADVLGWESYVVARADRSGQDRRPAPRRRDGRGRPLDALDLDVIALFSEGLGRRVRARRAARDAPAPPPRAPVRRQVDERPARSAGGRGCGLADPMQQPAADPALADALTARELEVLRLLARGQTNLAIANALVVREGTVKYHVKNILRKLGATSRADAVSRYVRAIRSRGGPMSRERPYPSRRSCTAGAQRAVSQARLLVDPSADPVTDTADLRPMISAALDGAALETSAPGAARSLHRGARGGARASAPAVRDAIRRARAGTGRGRGAARGDRAERDAGPRAGGAVRRLEVRTRDPQPRPGWADDRRGGALRRRPRRGARGDRASCTRRPCGSSIR